MRNTRGWPAGLALCAALLAACSTTVIGVARPDPVVASGLAAVASTDAAPPPTTAPVVTQPTTGTVPTAPPTRPSLVPGGGGVTGPPTTTTPAPPTTTTTTTTTAPTRSAATVPDQVDAGELFGALTEALGRHDRTAFLRRFHGAAATAAGQWWDNLDAIGFDGGAVGTYRNRGDDVALDPDGGGTLPVVLAGVHADSDRVGDNGARYVPTTAYRWTVSYSPGGLTVTTWTSLQHAPWDCGCRLHVARRGAAVVAAYPAEAALADDVVGGLAEALDWSATFGDAVDASWPALTGAVAFVTARPTRMSEWFRTRTPDDPDRDGYWAHPPPAYTYYLPGYDGPAVGIHHGGDFAGARIVLGPDGLTATTEQLVHELVHYRLSSEATANGFLTTQAWVEEGVAQMVQQIHVGTPAKAAAAGDWVVGTKKWGVGITAGRLNRDFHDRPPTSAQLYAADRASRFFWYQIAASFYDYLAVRYGLTESIDVATVAHAGHSPFDLVPDPDRPGRTLPAATVQRAWAAWVRETYG